MYIDVLRHGLGVLLHALKTIVIFVGPLGVSLGGISAFAAFVVALTFRLETGRWFRLLALDPTSETVTIACVGDVSKRALALLWRLEEIGVDVITAEDGALVLVENLLQPSPLTFEDRCDFVRCREDIGALVALCEPREDPDDGL